MSDSERPTLLSFPCAFPVKAIGYKSATFEQTVLTLIRQHAMPVAEAQVTTRDSGGGKFMAVTVTITATNQQQLDALYLELTRSPAVLMAL